MSDICRYDHNGDGDCHIHPEGCPKPGAMTLLERTRLLDLRLKSKRGAGLDERGLRFCQAMLKKDPAGYREVGDEVTRIVLNDWRAS